MLTEFKANPIKPPTYHRQRLLLFMLEQAGGTLGRLDLQKLLFLYVQESGTQHYAFVPYRFGSYSFLAADELERVHLAKSSEANTEKTLFTLGYEGIHFEALFAQYRKTLPDKTSGLSRVMDMLDQQKRVALTCFEKEPHCCHRHCVSDFLARRHGLSVIHL